jgi:hypothetical protein
MSSDHLGVTSDECSPLRNLAAARRPQPQWLVRDLGIYYVSSGFRRGAALEMGGTSTGIGIDLS